MVDEAQGLRARVLADLSKRRKVLHAQIEQLRAGASDWPRRSRTCAVPSTRSPRICSRPRTTHGWRPRRPGGRRPGRPTRARPRRWPPCCWPRRPRPRAPSRSRANPARGVVTVVETSTAEVGSDEPASEDEADDRSRRRIDRRRRAAPRSTRSSPRSAPRPTSRGRRGTPSGAGRATADGRPRPRPAGRQPERHAGHRRTGRGRPTSRRGRPAGRTARGAESPRRPTGRADRSHRDRSGPSAEADPAGQPERSARQPPIQRIPLVDRAAPRRDRASGQLSQPRRCPALEQAVRPVSRSPVPSGTGPQNRCAGGDRRRTGRGGGRTTAPEALDAEPGLEDADEAVVAEHIGSAFREWKGERIERLAGDHVVAAFSAGTMPRRSAGRPGSSGWPSPAPGTPPAPIARTTASTAPSGRRGIPHRPPAPTGPPGVSMPARALRNLGCSRASPQ